MKCSTCKNNLPTENFSEKKLGELYKACDICRKKNRERDKRTKCEHGKRKSRCSTCGDGSLCSHSKRRDLCRECEGGSYCEHDKVRSRCRECENGGGSYCEHGKRNSMCNICDGGEICIHKKERRKCSECDPIGYLSSIVRSSVYKAVTYSGHVKRYSSQKYLGCDIDKFKKHIEMQFEKGMNWENYGEWHIDHIVPLKYEDPTIEDLIERLHYLNTQPMWGEENQSKGIGISNEYKYQKLLYKFYRDMYLKGKKNKRK